MMRYDRILSGPAVGRRLHQAMSPVREAYALWHDAGGRTFMIEKFGKTFSFGGLLMAAVASILFVMSAATDARAWHNGHAHTGGGLLGGAIIGGAIGGAVKGKKGVLPGAIIGGAVGAAAASRARPAPPPPPRYYQPAPRPPVYTNSLVYNIQLSLTKLGYNPGPVDGVYGQRTADAISAYEYNNQLPVTGQATDGVYYHMKQSGG